MGGLSRDQKQVRGVLSKFDLLIALGADPVRMSVWSEVEPLPDGMPVVQIGSSTGRWARTTPPRWPCAPTCARR